MQPLGKLLIVIGIVMVGVGVLLMFFDKTPLLGRLPGDIHIQRDNFEFYFPLGTSIVISLVLTGIMWLVNYFGKE